MNKNTPGSEAAYPGGYVSSHDTGNDTAVKRPAPLPGKVSITEWNKCYEVTVPIPAAKKENIVVYVEDHVATVAVFKDSNILDKGAKVSVEELDILYRQKFNLPADADADFIHAEYDKGVLHMYISKSSVACNVSFHSVAVY